MTRRAITLITATVLLLALAAVAASGILAGPPSVADQDGGDPSAIDLGVQAQVAFGIVDGTCTASYDYFGPPPDLAALDAHIAQSGASRAFSDGLFVGELADAAASRNGRIVASSSTKAYVVWTDATIDRKTMTTLQRLTTPSGSAVWQEVATDQIVPCPSDEE
jgi:hypothetical protein